LYIFCICGGDEGLLKKRKYTNSKQIHYVCYEGKIISYHIWRALTNIEGGGNRIGIEITQRSFLGVLSGRAGMNELKGWIWEVLLRGRGRWEVQVRGVLYCKVAVKDE